MHLFHIEKEIKFFVLSSLLALTLFSISILLKNFKIVDKVAKLKRNIKINCVVILLNI